MKWRSLPPLSALRAFAAFSHTRSVVGAGDALGVSHAAISQQLRSLENYLGVALLDRSERTLKLTSQGETFAAALHASFVTMIAAAEDITGARDDKPLHISCTPTFAAAWLMPRLSAFRSAHPEIDITINPSAELVELGVDGVDLAIRYGAGPWPGLENEMLLRSPMVVVGAPKLVGDAPFTDLRKLSEFPWLEEFGTTESTKWLAQQGVFKPVRGGLMQVPGNLLLDGARDGQGVTVTVRDFVARDIASGRLRALHEEPGDTKGYHIVTRAGVVMRPALKLFVTWLRRARKI
ncbi:MAG: LysR substrate-binding domain-containing protein [Pseudomonadota bacterium]